MNEQAEQLVLDYLSRVGDAAQQKLRSDQRRDFLLRLRARIDEMRAPAGPGDPEQVRRVLARFGDPAALVAREQARLAGELAEGTVRGSDTGSTGGAGSAGGPDATTTLAGVGEQAIGHGEQDRANPPGEPTTEPLPALGSGARDAGRAAGTATSQAPADGSARAVEGPAGEASSAAAPPIRAPAGTPGAALELSGPPLYQPRPPRASDSDAPPALSRVLGQLPPGLRKAMRWGALEAVGIALVGVGGLFLPVPLWFIGAFVVSVAGSWSIREKTTALVPAPLLAVAVPGAVTALNAGDLADFLSSLNTHAWGLFRIGALLGAGYLALRLLVRARRHRSPRPPWARSNPNAWR